LLASREAKQILASSEVEWERIRPLVKAENDDVFTELKKDYRSGLLGEFGTKEMKSSKKVFNILAEAGGNALVGNATSLSDGLFWRPSQLSYLMNLSAINAIDASELSRVQ